MLCLLAVAQALAVAPAAAAETPTAAPSPLAAAVVSLLNGVRSAHGLSRLTASRPLTSAARSHSREMLADGYFGHSSADGLFFWQRIERYYGDGDVGENLLWASPEISARSALKAWMASPHHRANILDPEWREVGVGVAYAAAAPGWYGGEPATVVTTDFGVRR